MNPIYDMSIFDAPQLVAVLIVNVTLTVVLFGWMMPRIAGWLITLM